MKIEIGVNSYVTVLVSLLSKLFRAQVPRNSTWVSSAFFRNIYSEMLKLSEWVSPSKTKFSDFSVANENYDVYKNRKKDHRAFEYSHKSSHTFQ